MARPAIRRCASVNAADVAIQALGLNMATGERKGRHVVIKCGVVPIACVVAGGAVLGVPCGNVIRISRAVILFFVTGPAIRRSAGVLISGVTLCAVGLQMRTGQRKSG